MKTGPKPYLRKRRQRTDRGSRTQYRESDVLGECSGRAELLARVGTPVCGRTYRRTAVRSRHRVLAEVFVGEGVGVAGDRLPIATGPQPAIRPPDLLVQAPGTVPSTAPLWHKASPRQVSGRSSSSRGATPCSRRGPVPFIRCQERLPGSFTTQSGGQTSWHDQFVVTRSPATPTLPPTNPASASPRVDFEPPFGENFEPATVSSCRMRGSSALPGHSPRTANLGAVADPDRFSVASFANRASALFFCSLPHPVTARLVFHPSCRSWERPPSAVRIKST